MDYKIKIKTEGDYKEWIFQTSNGCQLLCKIRRNMRLYNLCGYVEITKDNKLFGLEYLDLYDTISKELFIPNVHGGVTYSGPEGNNWVFGFDCANYNDMIFSENFEPRGSGEYKDMDYVTKECESLAEQLSKFSISVERNKKIDDCLD